MEEMKLTLKEIVSQRLSAAPESAAKTELIEELAENLYCRYTDLVSSGVEPEDAKARAVDALGDTDELVEYLKSLEPDQPLPELVLDPDKEDGGQIEEILHNVEDILRGAFRKAKNAFKDAKDAVKEGFEAEISVKSRVVHGDDSALGELEQKMAETEAAMEAKQQEIEEAEEALEQLESARDALEAVSDQAAVEGALADIEVKIGAKEAEIEKLEAEHEALEEAYDALEEEFDRLEEELDELEDAELEELEDMEDMDEDEIPEKGWKVTYHSDNRDFEMNSEEFKASMKDMMKDIERVIRDATGAAKDAAKDAAKMAKHAREFVSQTCEDVSAACTPDSELRADQPIDAAQLKGIDVQNCGGDITIRMSQDPEGNVLVGGDIENIEVHRSADGVLTLRPVKTETSSFFFGRGIFNSSASADVELELPRRSWEFLKLATTNGDVEVSGDHTVDEVTITSVSGDICAQLPSCAKATCKTTNGDIRWEGDVSDFRMESISGDVQFWGQADSVNAKTTSGDLTMEGGICAALVKSISGEVCLRSCVMPDKMDITTTSGDMWVDIPDGGPFTARFRSTSGDFTSDFFTGRMGGRSCVFNYQGGGERLYTFGSISGDVELRKYR